jgi:hypothetical protein
VLFGNFLLAGIIVNMVIALCCFILLYQLTSFEFNTQVAKRATLFLALFPTSFYLAACYSEGLFIALAIGAFLAARRYQNWVLTGVLLGLAVITRNLGIFLLIPLGWEWLRQHYSFGENLPANLSKLWKKVWSLSVLALFGIPLLFLAGWLGLNYSVTGNPISFVSLQANERWGRYSAIMQVAFCKLVGILSPQ